jgi:hypothetical protein
LKGLSCNGFETAEFEEGARDVSFAKGGFIDEGLWAGLALELFNRCFDECISQALDECADDCQFLGVAACLPCTLKAINDCVEQCQ